MGDANMDLCALCDGVGCGVCHGVCVRLRLFGSFLLASASVALRFRSGNYMRVAVC